MIIGVILTALLTVLLTLVVRKFTDMAEDFDDYRQLAFEAKPKQKSVWISDWGTGRWVTIKGLKGKQRSKLLQDCTILEGKKAKVDLVKLYPMMVVMSVLYPDPSVPPPVDDPNYAKFPGLNGNPKHPKAGQSIFQDMRDILMLNEGPGQILELLNKPASELSGLREEDIEEKKDTFEMENVVESGFYTTE